MERHRTLGDTTDALATFESKTVFLWTKGWERYLKVKYWEGTRVWEGFTPNDWVGWHPGCAAQKHPRVRFSYCPSPYPPDHLPKSKDLSMKRMKCVLHGWSLGHLSRQQGSLESNTINDKKHKSLLHTYKIHSLSHCENNKVQGHPQLPWEHRREALMSSH